MGGGGLGRWARAGLRDGPGPSPPAHSCREGGRELKQYRGFLDSVGQRSTPVHQQTSMGGGLFVNSQLSPPTREEEAGGGGEGVRLQNTSSGFYQGGVRGGGG